MDATKDAPTACRSCGAALEPLADPCPEACDHACTGCGRHWAADEWTDDQVRLV